MSRSKMTLLAIMLTVSVFIFTHAILPIAMGQPNTTIYVDPPTTSAMPTEVIAINISIADAVGVYNWSIRISWMPMFFTVQDVTEGPFLASQAPAGTSFTYLINEYEGYIDLTDAMNGPANGASGSGTLATLTLMANDYGYSPIDLSRSELRDPYQGYIPHTLVGGSYTSTEHWTVELAVVHIPKRWHISAQGDAITFRGRAKNLAPVPLLVKIVFTGLLPDGAPFYLETGVITIDPGQIGPAQTALYGPLTVPDSVGSYHIIAVAVFSLNGIVFTEGTGSQTCILVVTG